jgi:hypothetical protein
MLKVGLIVPQGFATLSFAPLTVFEAANLVLDRPFYKIHVTSESGGRVLNSLGMEVMTRA